MRYNQKEICKFDPEIGIYEIYLEHGHGTMESPCKKGASVRTLECSEFDAWIISESMNIEKYGVIHKRSSWETPKYRYSKVEIG